MRVIETLPDFPAKGPTLRGLNLEAYQLLENVDKSRPVLKVDPQGQNVAALKRAFTRAAKELGGSVRSQNSQDGMVLVKWQSSRRQPAAASTKRLIKHSPHAIEQEMRRMNPNYEKLDATARRRLETSAKRNLSRRAGA